MPQITPEQQKTNDTMNKAFIDAHTKIGFMVMDNDSKSIQIAGLQQQIQALTAENLALNEELEKLNSEKQEEPGKATEKKK
ncbi:MAG: hypothetical protein JEZ12_15960 [Desulfobacterium sp.]|nr:hypothetical protein [Desulfobacterium sp.]